MLRRFTIVFSSVSTARSVDFIITAKGITAFMEASPANIAQEAEVQTISTASAGNLMVGGVITSDRKSAEGAASTDIHRQDRLCVDSSVVLSPDEDEEAQYWSHYDGDLQ